MKVTMVPCETITAPGGPAGVARLVEEVVFSPGPLHGVCPLEDHLRSAPYTSHAPETRRVVRIG